MRSKVTHLSRVTAPPLPHLSRGCICVCWGGGLGRGEKLCICVVRALACLNISVLIKFSYTCVCVCVSVFLVIYFWIMAAVNTFFLSFFTDTNNVQIPWQQKGHTDGQHRKTSLFKYAQMQEYILFYYYRKGRHTGLPRYIINLRQGVSGSSSSGYTPVSGCVGALKALLACWIQTRSYVQQ